MRDEAERLARLIARGDRSEATARAYLAAVERKKTDEKPRPARLGSKFQWVQGPTIRVDDHGEIANLLGSSKVTSLHLAERVLIDGGYSDDDVTDMLTRKVERLVPVVEGDLPAEVILAMDLRPERLSTADETLDGREHWTYEFALMIPNDWRIVEVHGSGIVLKGTVKGPGKSAVVVAMDPTTGDVVGRGLLGVDDPEIEFYDDGDLDDRYFAAIQGDLERRFVAAVDEAREGLIGA